MTIKIVTITGEANYGNSLQNYALVKTLKKMGLSAETIKTEYEPTLFPCTKRAIIQHVKVLIGKSDWILLFRKHRFKHFSDLYLSKTKTAISESAPKDQVDCDMLIFGSDQIWNFTWGGRLCHNINFYTGGFAPEIPKISFSASIGANYIPEEYKKTVAENLGKFSAISVREEKAKNILSELIENEIQVTCDPTMLLTRDEWLEIAQKPKYIKENKKFVLTYFLGDVSEAINDYISSIAKDSQLEVINLCGECLPLKSIKNPEYFLTDPAEFLWLVANCELVLTDSFHGCVFSMLMEKSFRCFERNDSAESMSSRMDTLFSTFEIDGWCKGNENEPVEHVFFKDYSQTPEILDRERTFAINYLKEELGINEI